MTIYEQYIQEVELLKKVLTNLDENPNLYGDSNILTRNYDRFATTHQVIFVVKRKPVFNYGLVLRMPDNILHKLSIWSHEKGLDHLCLTEEDINIFTFEKRIQ